MNPPTPNTMPIAHTELADALCAPSLQQRLAAAGCALPVTVEHRCTSTNARLLADAASGHPHVLFAEEQTEGRGLRGRRWLTLPGHALTFSLRWYFNQAHTPIAGLPLAIGVGLANALHTAGAHAVRLKWPNDLLVGAAKLGGVLIESRQTAHGLCVVIGVGLNVRTQPDLQTQLRRPVIALEDCAPQMTQRNPLAAQLVLSLHQTLHQFSQEGFSAFVARWQALHAFQGQRLHVRLAGGRRVAGAAEGVSSIGELLLRNRRGLRRIHSGHVMLSGAHA
jgi:BirA family transcriptional regulator, biotin operon repressor / biotin---[acetyl-CoA-carboxylase] ligase